MLSQYKLTLESADSRPLAPDMGYKLYAELLKCADSQFGKAMHRDMANPVSQHLTIDRGIPVWTVNLLGEYAEEILSPTLEEKQEYPVTTGNCCFTVKKIRKRTVASVEELFSLADRISEPITLDFVTPTAFKSQGQYVNLPTSRLIIQNLVKKWNETVVNCPIEDEDGEGLETLAEGIRFRRFILRDAYFHLKGNTIPGFTGTIKMENRLDGFHRELADALLLFSEYAGIGIKTTLGMGGVQLR